jgi:hypothetical protein
MDNIKKIKFLNWKIIMLLSKIKKSFCYSKNGLNIKIKLKI